MTRQPHPTKPEDAEKRLQLAEAEIVMLRAALFAVVPWPSKPEAQSKLPLKDAIELVFAGAKDERFMDLERSLAFDYMLNQLMTLLSEDRFV